jgi:hypothetical protein
MGKNYVISLDNVCNFMRISFVKYTQCLTSPSGEFLLVGSNLIGCFLPVRMGKQMETDYVRLSLKELLQRHIIKVNSDCGFHHCNRQNWMVEDNSGDLSSWL